MPSFDEWKQKQEEQQINHIKDQKSQTVAATGQSITNGGGQPGKKKINYSAVTCGAKILQANPESQNPSSILKESKDDYMNNPCTAKNGFTVQLCEGVEIQSIELGNLEFFSSMPASFDVHISERFPVKEWKHLGKFNLTDEKAIQKFDISFCPFYAKFIRIDILDHYGTEHYCPISILRVFGVSVEDDEEVEMRDDQEYTHDTIQDKQVPDINLIKKATDTVISIMKTILPSSHPSSDSFITSTNHGTTATFDKNRFNVVLNFSLTSEKSTLARVQQDFLRHCLMDLSTIEDHYPTFKHLNLSLNEHSTCLYFKTFLNITTSNSSIPSLLFTPTYEFLKVKYSDLFQAAKAAENSSNSRPSLHKILPAEDIVMEININVNKEVIEKSGVVLTLANDSAKVQVPSNSATVLESEHEMGNHTEQTVNPNEASGDGKAGSEIELELQMNSTILDEIKEKSKENNDSIISLDLTVPSSSLSSLQSSSSPPSESSQSSSSPPETSFDPPASSLTPPPSSSASSPPPLSKLEPLKDYESSEVPYQKTLSKESMFMKLKHRIKQLENSLNLTNRYLDELSKRYKKEMEEMYDSMNKTISKLINTALSAEERDLEQQDRILGLERQAPILNSTSQSLKDSLNEIYARVMKSHLVLILIELCVFVGIASFCCNNRRHKVVHCVKETKKTITEQRFRPKSGVIDEKLKEEIKNMPLVINTVKPQPKYQINVGDDGMLPHATEKPQQQPQLHAKAQRKVIEMHSYHNTPTKLVANGKYISNERDKNLFLKDLNCFKVSLENKLGIQGQHKDGEATNCLKELNGNVNEDISQDNKSSESVKEKDQFDKGLKENTAITQRDVESKCHKNDIDINECEDRHSTDDIVKYCKIKNSNILINNSENNNNVKNSVFGCGGFVGENDILKGNESILHYRKGKFRDDTPVLERIRVHKIVINRKKSKSINASLTELNFNVDEDFKFISDEIKKEKKENQNCKVLKKHIDINKSIQNHKYISDKQLIDDKVNTKKSKINSHKNVINHDASNNIIENNTVNKNENNNTTYKNIKDGKLITNKYCNENEDSKTNIIESFCRTQDNKVYYSLLPALTAEYDACNVEAAVSTTDFITKSNASVVLKEEQHDVELNHEDSKVGGKYLLKNINILKSKSDLLKSRNFKHGEDSQRIFRSDINAGVMMGKQAGIRVGSYIVNASFSNLPHYVIHRCGRRRGCNKRVLWWSHCFRKYVTRTTLNSF